jgi:hypothetical protein
MEYFNRCAAWTAPSPGRESTSHQREADFGSCLSVWFSPVAVVCFLFFLCWVCGVLVFSLAMWLWFTHIDQVKGFCVVWFFEGYLFAHT